MAGTGFHIAGGFQSGAAVLAALLAVSPDAPARTYKWVDEAGIFVAEGRAVLRFDPDGGNRTAFANGEADVTRLFSTGRVLALGSGRDGFVTMDKNTGEFLSTFSNRYANAGFSTAPSLHRGDLESTITSFQQLWPQRHSNRKSRRRPSLHPRR